MHKGTSRDIYLMLWEFWNRQYLSNKHVTALEFASETMSDKKKSLRVVNFSNTFYLPLRTSLVTSDVATLGRKKSWKAQENIFVNFRPAFFE